MPGEGSLYKVLVGNHLVGYVGGNQDALAIEAPDGTKTVVVDTAGNWATASVEDFEVTDDLTVGDDAAIGGDATVTGRARAGILSLGAAEDVTIATGVATITKSLVELTSESSTTDQLDTLTMSGAAEGDIVILTAAAGHTITVDDANIDLGAANRAIGADGSLVLRRSATGWVEVAFLASADNS